ncbi:MAG: creatininase family protein [Rhizobiaceae bacterium]
MRLDLCTWLEVEAYLERSNGIVIPVGSNEQHGPMGLIGTDALCAEAVALEMAEIAQALVAPSLCYTPAPFNTAFPGTVSISEGTFLQMVTEIVDGLASQGFGRIYFLNGHGANLAPLHQLSKSFINSGKGYIRIRSWWDFETVNQLRQTYYGDWEGMHATPSEVSITQATHRIVDSKLAADPPKKLNAEFIKSHAGDKHGPPDAHRAEFPDGRVGSHSALARPDHGKALLQAAAKAAAADYLDWLRQAD